MVGIGIAITAKLAKMIENSQKRRIFMIAFGNKSSKCLWKS